MPKIWIDPGHGGKDIGAEGCGRRESEDNLTYALELCKQFEAQGFETVLTRTTDKAVSLNERTTMERNENCDLAISCHRNGFHSIATGFEIWQHSAVPQSYVDWANKICEGVKSLGLPLHGNIGVKKGFPGYPKGNYYANSGTNSPSMLVEFGYMQNPSDNAFFDAHYKEVCTIIVKASCNFLGVKYSEAPVVPIQPEDSSRVVELEAENAELREKIAETDALRRIAVQNLADMAAKIIADINMYTA